MRHQASTDLVGEEPDTAASWLARVFLQEDLNFLVTNRLPRRYATMLMAWFAQIESRWLTRLSLFVWQRFSDDLRLHEARTSDFKSLHEVFVRELREGARPVDPRPEVLVSPCDAIVGASGRVREGQVFQVKGSPYQLTDLIPDEDLVERVRDGSFVTLRLKSNMYHRFHAPADAHIERVHYISGDTWNVNPITLKRVERLFCKNERAVLDLRLTGEAGTLALVPVAAILVGGIHFKFLAEPLNLKHRGQTLLSCDARVSKGDELGHFQSGSTILVFASRGFELCENVVEGRTLRVGQMLFRKPGPVVPPASE